MSLTGFQTKKSGHFLIDFKGGGPSKTISGWLNFEKKRWPDFKDFKSLVDWTSQTSLNLAIDKDFKKKSGHLLGHSFNWLYMQTFETTKKAVLSCVYDSHLLKGNFKCGSFKTTIYGWLQCFFLECMPRLKHKSDWTGPEVRCMGNKNKKKRNPTKVEQIFRTRA